jgi:hypothetical protein
MSSGLKGIAFKGNISLLERVARQPDKIFVVPNSVSSMNPKMSPDLATLNTLLYLFNLKLHSIN